MKPKHTLRSFITLRSFLTLAGSSLLAIPYTHAANIWDGGAGTGAWNTGANWDDDLVPAANAILTFTGNVQNLTNNDTVADRQYNGILFTNDGTAGKTNGFTLAGARITLGGNIVTTASSSAITNNISLNMILNGNRTITTNANHNVSISGVISQDASARGLIKDGAGILTLSGTNLYSGGTTINAGIVRAGASTTVLGTGSLVFANFAGAAFELNGFNVTVNQLTGGGASGGNVVLSTGNTLTVGNIGGTYSGIISGGGNMSYGGSSGGTSTGAHTYTGSTTITTGNTTGIIVSSLANGGVASGIGASSSAAANLVFVGSGTNHSSVRYNSSSNASTDREFTLSGNGGFGVYGAGALNLSSTAAVTHGNVAAKFLLLCGNGAGGGTMAAQITDSGTGSNITGIQLGFVNSANSGANWSLTNANNTFSGTILHSATNYAGGTFSYASAGGSNAITFSQTSGTGGISYIGAADKTMSGLIQANALSSGIITLGSNGAGAVNYSNTGSLGVGGASGAKGLVLNGTNTGNNTLAGGWNNNTLGGAATVTKNGTGKWILSGSNNYSGLTNVTAGVLNIQSASALGSTTGGTTVATGAALEIQGGISVAEGITLAGTTGISSGGGIRNISGNNTLTGAIALTVGASRINSDSGTLTLNVASGDIFSSVRAMTFGGAGNITISDSLWSSGAGSVTKDGAGTLTLSASSGYSGATNVNEGTLLVNNTTGSGTGTGTVTVAVGATLGGSGIISGDTIINGIHSPGNSPGLIGHTNLTYNGGAIVPWELIDNTIGTRGTDYDGINVTGVLTFNGATTLSLDFQHTPAGTVEWNDAFWDLNYTGTNGWLVYDGANPIVGFDNLTLNAPANWLDQNGDTLTSSRSTGNFFLFHDTTNNDIYLNFVPEPSTTLLGGLGLLALLRRRR
jgi:fibronectin-binding autotransporter adhesin